MVGVRSMPIVYSFIDGDPYIFPSETVLNKFRHTDLESDSIDVNDVGLPLFQINEKSAVMRMLGRSSFEIFRFESGGIGYKEEVGAKPVIQYRNFSIYKVPFCWVSRKHHVGKTTYNFRYHEAFGISDHELVQSEDGFSGTLNGTPFKYVSSSEERVELTVVADSNVIPSMVFTMKDRDHVPRKYSKSASLVINDFSPDQVPKITIPLACQALLLNLILKTHINQNEKNEPLPTRSQAWDSLEAIRKHH